MFHKILVALDGSDVSILAFNRALDMSRENKSELHLVYIVEQRLATLGPNDGGRMMILQKFEEEGRELLNKYTDVAKTEGINAISHLLTGHAAGEEIVNLSSELDCDLLVVGSNGKSALDRLLIGSVSSFVVKSAKTNIMVVRN